jgi:hypothetical protein
MINSQNLSSTSGQSVFVAQLFLKFQPQQAMYTEEHCETLLKAHGMAFPYPLSLNSEGSDLRHVVYDLAPPPPPPPSPIRELSLFLNLPVCRRVNLTDGGEAKLNDREKAWSSINHSILSVSPSLPFSLSLWRSQAIYLSLGLVGGVDIGNGRREEMSPT